VFLVCVGGGAGRRWRKRGGGGEAAGRRTFFVEGFGEGIIGVVVVGFVLEGFPEAGGCFFHLEGCGDGYR
jgi:hypothetical protein